MLARPVELFRGETAVLAELHCPASQLIVLVAEAPHSASTLQAIREENGSSNTAAIGAVMLFTYQLQFGQTVSSYW